MSTIITCSTCGGKLRLPDELIGQDVRCPMCSVVFTAAASSPAPAAVPPPLDLAPANGRGNGQQTEPAAAKRGGLVGAVEVQLSLDDDAPSRPVPPRPAEAPPLPQPPPRRDWREEDRDWEPRRSRDWDRDSERFLKREPNRRDLEPNRGVLILVLGIISLATLVFSLWPLGLIFGAIAWIMGRSDLKKIKANQMDPDNSGLTTAGWICGIIGTLINTLLTLSCFGFISFMMLSAPARPAVRYGPPAQQFNGNPPFGNNGGDKAAPKRDF